MKNKKLLIALGAVCLVNFIAHLCFYPAMPDTVPMHWGFNGQVDGWGPKYMVLVTALIPAAILLLIAVVPKIDPAARISRNSAASTGAFWRASCCFCAESAG